MSDSAFWLRLNRRAAALQPDLARELQRAFRTIRESLSDAELARLIASGQLDQLLDQALLDRAFGPVRQRIQEIVRRGFDATIRDLPRAGKVDGVVGVGFDYLNPEVINAIRALDSRILNTLTSETREMVRAFVERGLREGLGPRAIARDLRAIIGMAPNQQEAVRNFRRALEGQGRSPLDYALRDRRFDSLIRRGAMTPGRIDRAVAAYERRMLAFNAETNARTATLDSLRLGQHLAWEDAVAKGLVDGARLRKEWNAVAGPIGDGRNRPEHLAMHGETVPFDAYFSNGEMIPGESVFNCRCGARYFQALPARRVAPLVLTT